MPLFFDEDTAGWVRWTAAGLVVFVLVVIAGVVVLVTTGGEEAPGQPGTGAGTPTEGSSSAAASSSICGLPDGDQSIPTNAPDATWETVGNYAMPTSAAFGPGIDSGGKRSCFAHSPTGALFAAMNSTDDPNRPNVNGAMFAGFRIDDYSGDEASLQIALRATSGPKAGLLIAVPLTVSWEHGDWAGDEDELTPVALASLDGFTAFGPGGSS